MIPLGTDIQRICHFLVGHVPDADFSERGKISQMTIDRWGDATAQPSDAAIVDAGNDLTIVGGETFSQWLISHGGDPVFTRRREAVERLDDVTPSGVKARAILVYMAKQHNDLLAWLGAQTTLTNRSQLNDFKITRAGAKAAIDAGDGDS